ncbi:glycosyltransferase family 2 protein [Pseudoalteromonas carrageenovora]|uniref:glycosyltransferase family 2 protein n=1 Tax=Pseudoalteromonas carrageenovora TaxID=227 RepID=UPI0026E1A60E|nr:glycosyltransferase family 2 protein [Pseudoalteromonas carrageenovora]MDO6835607.1 glycosyltransferase family 2 protein [Pseudoalteromonas carrageenovora]
MKVELEVSVIIAAWNSEKFISKAIDSALQQDINLEVIVVDDFSNDNTCSVVENYKDERVRLIRSSKNGGPGAARNIGFSAAKGKWIAVLDSDDYFLPNRLNTMINSDDGTADILIDDFYMCLGDPNELKPFYTNNELKKGNLSLAEFIAGNSDFMGKKTTGYVKPIFLKSFLITNKVRYWPEVRIGEDYYFLASCLAAKAKAKVVEVCGYVYNIRGDSISGKLNQEHIDKFQWGDKKFADMYLFQPLEYKAFKLRSRNLSKTKSYISLVESIKNKKVLKSLCIVIANPRACSLLWLPIRKRLLN